MRSAIQYKPECCLRVPVPGLRSFLAPHPDRSHQGSPITPRRTTGAENCAHRALSVPPCGRFAWCLLPSAPFKSPHSPTAISPCASPNTNRSAVFNPSGSRRIRADLVPVGFNTAPSQRAGDRRSNRYAAFGHSIVFSMTIPLRSALSWNLL